MREINIGAGTLSRPIEEVVATLLVDVIVHEPQSPDRTSSSATPLEFAVFVAIVVLPFLNVTVAPGLVVT